MKEKCIRCGVKTPYDRDTDIVLRYYYIEGAGHLCRNCYNLIYGNGGGTVGGADKYIFLPTTIGVNDPMAKTVGLR